MGKLQQSNRHCAGRCACCLLPLFESHNHKINIYKLLYVLSTIYYLLLTIVFVSILGLVWGRVAFVFGVFLTKNL